MMHKTGMKYKSKVESKLNVETKAMEGKKREKFDEGKGHAKRDAMTMGGNLLGVGVRAMPMWRAGVLINNFNGDLKVGDNCPGKKIKFTSSTTTGSWTF